MSEQADQFEDEPDDWPDREPEDAPDDDEPWAKTSNGDADEI